MDAQQNIKKIVIDLSNPSDALLLEENQFFQRHAFAELRSKILARIKDVNPDNDSHQMDSFYTRLHATITISGVRGSGKTTFLLNALARIRKEESLGIVDLRIIDPTLISTKEHVLVTIISLIKREINKHQDKENIADVMLEKWRGSLRDLAGGLCQIDGIGPDKLYGDGWDDKTYILETGLEKAIEGFEFEKNLNEFLRVSLKVLKRKAFIVVFDDIDTKFESGWPVLESIRKYLTSPYLITIISGDIELYKTVIRRAQFQTFGELSLRYDRPSVEYHDEVNSLNRDPLIQQIDRLEEQFIMKLLKPENRIPLQSLERIGASEFMVASSLGGENPIALTDYLNKIFRIGLGVQASVDLTAFSSSILQLPIRTVWQFLKAGEILHEDNSHRRYIFAEQVIQIFSSSLYRSQINPDELDFRQHDVSQGVNALWKWANESGNWEEVYRLYPEFLDSAENQLAIAFGTYFSAQLSDSPASIFEFMVKAGWARELLLQNQDHEEKANRVLAYLGLNKREKTATVARRGIVMQRTVQSALKSGGIYRGTIHVPSSPRAGIGPMAANLYGVEKLDKPQVARLKEMIEHTLSGNDDPLRSSSYLGQWWTQVNDKLQQTPQQNLPSLLGIAYNTLDSLSRKFGGTGDIVRLAASTALEPAKGEKSSYLSVYALIGAVGELISAEESEMHQTFSWLAQQRVYPTPPWLLGAANTGVSDSDVGEDIETYGDGIREEFESNHSSENSNFIAVMSQWIKAVKRNSDLLSSVPPYIFSRIMARLFFTLERMDTELARKDLYTGNVLHRQIVAFLNAVLVEERRSQKREFSKIILANPTTSDFNFIKNFNSAVDSNGSLKSTPLFHMMFTCPLFGIFMAPAVKNVKSGDPDWRWLDKQADSWREFCAVTDERVSADTFVGAMRVTGVIHPLIGEVEFENLWAPLNTVPMLGARKENRDTLIKPLPKARKPKLDGSIQS